jgi:hypothetical protein
MSSGETAAEAKLKAGRDKEIALANADLQKQLTGNETAYATAVNNANSAFDTATTNTDAALKSAKQTALSQLNSALAQSSKDKDTAIAGAERTYDQVVAALDAQYGSSSSNGDTGIEGARRDASISTRDAQYYASRDTSWASALNSSASLGTSPWIVKERTSANAQAAYSTSRATAQAAHDAALLSAVDNWQTSNRASTLSLLLAEGQSREGYHKATANVYANWEMGVGKLFADKPDGTRWSDESDESQANEDPTPVSGLVGIFSFEWFGDEEDKEDTSDLPEDPSVAEIANDKIVQYRDAIKSLPSFSCSLNPIEQWVHTGIRNWGVDLFAGAVAVGLHDTIKKVDPTANADAAFLLAWAGESNIPSLMTVNDPIHSQTAEFVQSLARDKAIELNRGHAGLGVSGTPVMDEVAFEAPTSLLSAGLPKMLGMGARVSKKISEEGIELVLDTARRLDDEAIEAIWRAGETLDNADGIPLEKVLDVVPNSGLGEPVLFGQRRVGPSFSVDQRFPNTSGRSLADVVADLRSGTLTPDDLPLTALRDPATGNLVSMNTRTRAVLAEAGLEPTKVEIIDLNSLSRSQRAKYLRRLRQPLIIDSPLPGYRVPVTPNMNDLRVMTRPDGTLYIIEIPR